MKVAVVIFSFNANQKKQWESVLSSYAVQNEKYTSYILVDSESTDETTQIAQKYGWTVSIEKQCDFNHGKTRQKMVDNLLDNGYDIAVFATQDVVLMSETTLSTLVDNLQSTGAAVAYARQVPADETSFDGHFRLRNYPSTSMIKDSGKIRELGLMTPFVSDSLAAWNLKKVREVGGFPSTEFGEDMLLGAKFIFNNEKISYCAESCCLHEHESSLYTIFKRGLEIGKMHKRNPYLKKNFGQIESCAKHRLTISEIVHYFFPLAVKYLGYRAGHWQAKRKK